VVRELSQLLGGRLMRTAVKEKLVGMLQLKNSLEKLATFPLSTVF
jgi:hypothetical protein